MVEEMAPEEVMEHLPAEVRDLVAHLRVGVLSLPGVEERGAYDSEEEDYSIQFTVGSEDLLRAHSAGGLWASVELSPEDVDSLRRRADLPEMELETREGNRTALKEVLERAGTCGTTLEVAIKTQDDLRSLLRIVHAKYDALMAR